MATLKINADGTFTITGKIDDVPRPSSTGKTLIVTTTSGFIRTSEEVHGKPVSLSLTLTIPNK
jgi:hypothetical protein